jgi:hypothetical protein
MDVDADGKIDQIKITMDDALDDDFSGLTMSVAGYTVTGYSTDIANDNIYYINLAESGSSDTDATPVVLVAANSTLSGSGGNVEANATDWWDTDWQNRKRITFDNTASAQDLTDFPVLVRLTAADIDFSIIKSDGADLRFIDDDGTSLDYEIEAWDDTAQTATVWVKVQQIDQLSSSDFIHIYYNNAAAMDAQNSAAVWPAGIGVWHMDEDPGPGGAGDIKDSDASSNNGTAESSMTTGDVVTGQIGNALDFDEVDDYINFASTDVGDTFTIEAWVKPDSSGTKIQTIAANSVGGSSTDGFRFFINSSGTTDGSIHFETGNGSSGNAAITSTGVINFDQWNHVAVEVDRASGLATIYHNGVDVTSDSTIRTDFNTTSDWEIGRMEGGNGLNGVIDEFRISGVAHSADRIEADYLSQNAAFTFSTIGSQEIAVAADKAAPVVLSRQTADLDNDGFIDAIHLTLSEAIQDSTINAADWDVAGVTGEAFSSTTNGDTADDADFYITFADGVLDTGATPLTTYVQNATADAAGNLLGSESVAATDNAAAVLISASTPQSTGSSLFQVEGQQLDLVFSESLGGAVSEVNLEAALLFATGTTDGDNLPTIGTGNNPISLVTTTHINDTLRVTFNADNTANADGLRVGTPTVQVATGTNITDAAGNTANTAGAAVTITGDTNDAPVLDNTGTMTLTTINEDNFTSSGNTVASIILSAGGDRISDNDTTPVEGIAVIGVDDTNGTWQYNTGSGWAAFGAVSNTSAVVLDASDAVRFVPDADYAGSSGDITFRAWDQTSGHNNGATAVNVASNGGTSSFSAATETASLTVTEVNDAPTITGIADQTPVEDTATGNIAFTIGDLETAVGTLTVTATSSDQTLIPDGNITLGGTGANRTINILPAANQSGGPTTITVSVSDGTTMTQTTFDVTVSAVNDAPEITAIADQTPLEDTATGAIAFKVGDAETAAGSLTITATSSDQTLVPDGNITLSGTGANRTINVLPAANQTGGPATITVTVSDGATTTQTTFDVTVSAVNDAPTISTIADQTPAEDTATGNIAFTISDTETAAGTLTVTATSSDQTLVPDGNITLGGTGGNRTINLLPATNQTGGPATITVSVSDGTTTTQTTFDVTVSAVNDAPTISAIADQTPAEDTATGNIAFTIGDTETAAGTLTVTATSSDQTLVPDGNITLAGTGANRTINLLPATNQTGGPATITVSVSDGTTTTQTTFDVTVSAVNDAPTISAIADQTPAEDTATGNIAFTISDAESAAGTLTVTATSSDQTLVPDGNITLGGTGANRTINLLPGTNQTGGPATITVTVSDGTTTTQTTFDVTVSAVNDLSIVTTDATTLVYGGSSSVDIDSTLTVTDIDSSTLVSAEVQLANGFVQGEDTLVFVDQLGITGTFDGVTGTLTLTGSATVADYETALRSVKYQNINSSPTFGMLTVGFTVNDGTDVSSVATRNLEVIDEDPPRVTDDSATVVEGGAVVIDLAANDSDNFDLLDLASISIVAGPSNGTVLVNGDGTVTYTHDGSETTTDTFTYTIEDTSNLLSNIATVSLTVSPANDAPVIAPIADQTPMEDTATGAIAFTISDAESAAGTLTVTAASSDQTLVPDGNITLGGSGADRTIDIMPAANQTGGPATITVTVSDGTTTTQTTFDVTIIAANDAPTITPIADQAPLEDTATGDIAFTISDAESAAGTLTVTATSSDQSLVPDGNITLAGTGANRTINVLPAANQTGGPATITVTVSDGTTTTKTSFDVTVSAVNDVPTITTIADQTPVEDTATGNIAFTISDMETAAGTLTVTATSSDQSLVPDGNITLAGTGANRTINALPATNQTGGPATITVTVSDGTTTTKTTFDVTVSAVNDVPTITAIADQTPVEDTATGNIAFTISDVEAAAGTLTVTATSSDQSLVPDGNITLGGTGANRTINVLPAANQTGGPATITVTVSDGTTTTQTTFDVTVSAVNDVPTITTIADQTPVEDTATGDIAFTISDVDAAAGTLTVTATSSDQSLVPDGNITLGGTGANRTINVLPAANQTGGPATITVTVSDGTTTTQTTFDVTVSAVNDVPTITTIADQTPVEDTATGDIAFTIADAETAAGTLTVTATSNDQTLVSDGSITLSGTGANRTINVLPAANQTGGPATITVTVSDGTTITQTTFDVTIIAANDAPIDVTLSGSVVNENASSGTIVGSASGTDPDAGDSLTFSLINSASGRFAVDANTGQLTVADGNLLNFEVASSHGITVRVTDSGGLSRDESYIITVSDLNEAPTALNDTFSARQLEDLVVPAGTITANDFDVDGDSVTVVLVAGPAEGTLTLAADGSFTYMSTGSFSGQDQFTYYVTDGTLNSAVATVSIDVLTTIASSDVTLVADDDASSKTQEHPVDTQAADGSDTTEELSGDVAISNMVSSVSGTTTESVNETRAAPEIPVDVLQPASSELSVSVFLSDVPESGFPSKDVRTQQNDSAEPSDNANVEPGRFLFGQVDTDSAFFAAGQVNLENRDYWQQQDDRALQEQAIENMVVGSTAMVSTSVSVGYVVWLLRGGSLLTTVLSSLPAWQTFDPLHVLNSFEENNDDDNDNESLASLVS